MKTPDPSLIKPLLKDFLPQKFLSGRLLRFVEEEGILCLFEAMRQFDFPEAVEALRGKGYLLSDRTRLRMIKVLIDFLSECGYVVENNGRYTWNDGNMFSAVLGKDESGLVKGSFRGQIDFFEECIHRAASFLRGGPPLCGFDSGSLGLWEKFLGNAEFRFARSVLAEALLSGRERGSSVLALCYGPGFDIRQLQEEAPDAGLSALDFKGVFFEGAYRRSLDPQSVQWIDPLLWKGFGDPLPFRDFTFDYVFFACADPYIPEELRESVYADIFRVLKPGGALGILTRSYPDRERTFVTEPWIRRGVCLHDFAEGLCEGWNGFYDAGESAALFSKIGYTLRSLLLSASVWRLDKPA